MKLGATRIARVAERYAIALFEIADEEKVLDTVAADLRGFASLVNGSVGLREMINSPVLGREEQGRLVAALAEAAALQLLTRNFLGLLARNRRLFALPAMIEHFLATLAARRGEVTADVVTAQALTQEQHDRLSEQLRRSVGQKVAIDVRVDPGLLGGLVVKLGSRMVDASLKSKLHRLEMAMKGIR